MGFLCSFVLLSGELKFFPFVKHLADFLRTDLPKLLMWITKFTTTPEQENLSTLVLSPSVSTIGQL